MKEGYKEIIIPGQEPSALKKHPSNGGYLLQRFPDEVIKRGEEDGRPWIFLASLPNITDDERRFFEMGRSVSDALYNLLLMKAGSATKHGSKPVQLNNAETILKRQYAQGFDYNTDDPKISHTLKKWRDEQSAAQSKRNGKNWKFDQVVNLENLIPDYPQEVFMIMTWMRWGFDGIGMGFFSNRVVTDVMQSVFPQLESDDPEKYYIDRIRRRLKLKPFNSYKPVVVKSHLHQTKEDIHLRVKSVSKTMIECSRGAKGDCIHLRLGRVSTPIAVNPGMISITYLEKTGGEVKKAQGKLPSISIGKHQIYPSKFYA